MPQVQPKDAVSAKSTQFKERAYIVFRNFETMDTQADRLALDPRRPNWLENLQPISGNDLVTVPGIAAAISTVAGQTITKKFYANYGGNDYIIAFTQSGAGYQVNIATGTATQFAAPGSYTDPDVTQWKSERILIADSLNGYSTWDGIVYVKKGGVSPVIRITNGGSGYATPPTVTISGGTGAGATATAAITAGVVTSVTLTNPGTGYVAGDVLTVAFAGGGGAGAAATAIIWPILAFPVTTVAVFQGRVWLAGARVLQWTGTQGFDDTNPANAAGNATISDADLVREVTALRSLNNYLYIFGDNSIKQIGTITVSGSNTLFTITTLSSDQGTTFPQSIVSYNRLILFANFVGVWAVFGASVEKISDPMDGVFRNVDFTQKPISCPVDLNNIRVYMLLVKYNDPGVGSPGNPGGLTAGTRSVFLAFMNKKWFVISQGSTIRAAASAPVGGVLRVYVSSGNDVSRVLADSTVSIPVYIRTSLFDDQKPMLGKRALRIGIAHSSSIAGNITATIDSENTSIGQTYALAFPVQWINALGGIVTWINSGAQVVTFTGRGFQFRDLQGGPSGIYLGGSLAATFAVGFRINSLVLEYQDATLMRSRNTA